MRGKYISLMASGFTAWLMFVNQAAVSVQALEADAAVTEENILELLDEYDPDGAFIVRYDLGLSDSSTMFWLGNSNRIIDNINTAVHEDTHIYSFNSAGFYTENIYTGNGEAINVKIKEVYSSSEMAKEIPEELRTFRYDTYVGEDAGNLDSNVKGIYGLLNEFTAYCWDMNTTIRLYDYYREHANTSDDWVQYANLIGNGRTAYSEFNYYILNYVKYSKEHYPEVYSSIMNNPELLNAYIFIENKYSQLFETSEFYISEISSEASSAGYITEYYKKDYDKLLSETAKDEYQQIFRDIADKNTENTSGSPDEPVPAEIKGDINGDGKTNAADMIMLSRFLTGTEVDIVGADLNGDNTVNVLDMIYLKRMILSAG